MYIADLTEILCRKKRLPLPASDWVLCLADYSLAIPVDRTVASLEGQTDLALVKAQWAAQKGLRTGLRRGGDPNGTSLQSCLNQTTGLGGPAIQAIRGVGMHGGEAGTQMRRGCAAGTVPS